MRILQVNNVYDRLSTGKIVSDLHREYKKIGIDSYVAYARGPKVQEEGVFKFNDELYAKINKIRAYITGVRYGGQLLSTFRLVNQIKRINPDIVHLHCINDDAVNIYQLLAFLKKRKIKTVVTLHAEFFHTGHCGHAYSCNKWLTGCGDCPQIKQLYALFDNTRRSWLYMKEAFDGFNQEDIIFASVSPWLRSRATQSPFIGNYRHVVVLNGLETQSFYPIPVSSKEKKELTGSDKPCIMFVTSSFWTKVKGIDYLIEFASRHTDYDFIILGQKEEASGIPSNILQLGRIYDREIMAKLYTLSEATIVLSKAETFSMPTAESLCCGTPVFGFKAGGPETIALEEFSVFVKNGDMKALDNAFKQIQNLKVDRAKLSTISRRMYSKKCMADNYIAQYSYLIRKRMIYAI